MAHDTKVEAELKLDDHASEALEHIKGGFEHVHEKVTETSHEMLGMMKQAAAMAIGFQLSGMIDSFKEMATEAFHASTELEEQNKELTGLVMIADKAGLSFEQAQEKAEHLNNELEEMGTKAGVAKRDMIDAFEMIAQRSTRGTAAVTDMVGKMSLAARAIKGGMPGMAAAWRDLEMGILRPKNALVMLMKQTGEIEGPIKKATKAMNAMMQTEEGKEKVFAIAERAIVKMADKMKDAPPTFAMMVNSLQNVREGIFETMGDPMVKAIMGPLTRLQKYMEDHREEIEKVAQTIGVRVGEWITKAAEMIQHGFEYLKNHSTEILDALEKGANALKSAVGFMVDHKEILLAIAGAKLMGGAGMGGAGGGKLLPGMAGAAYMLGGEGGGVGGEMGRMGAGIGGMALSGAMMFGPLGAAAGAAAGAVAELVHQIKGLSDDRHRDNMANANAEIDAMSRVLAENTDLTKEQVDEFSRYHDAIMTDADITEEDRKALLAHADAMWAQHQAAKVSMESLDALARQMIEKGVIDSKPFVDAFNQATAQHDKAAIKHIAHLLESSYDVEVAFFNSGNIIGEGMKDLMDAMTNTSEDMKKKLQALATPPPGETGGPPLPHYSLSGGGPVHIEIKQDFRDQDPDRIALIFRRDLQRQAVSAVTARTSAALGL